MADIRVRVGQQNAVRVLSSAAGGTDFALNANTAKNVVGGIASVTQLYNSGISTFVGSAQFDSGVSLGSTSTDSITVSGVTTFYNEIYQIYQGEGIYSQSHPNHMMYFDSNGKIEKTLASNANMHTSNSILTTQSGTNEPIWTQVIDGGTY
jgi:hypothetical protein